MEDKISNHLSPIQKEEENAEAAEVHKVGDSKVEATEEIIESLVGVSVLDFDCVKSASIQVVDTIEPDPVEQSKNLVLMKIAINDLTEADTAKNAQNTDTDTTEEHNPIEQIGPMVDVPVESNSVDQNRFEAIKEMEPNSDKPQGSEIVKLMESHSVKPSDNLVLRKLLRGPRYFDPPESSWDKCYKCGRGGHRTVNCTSVKKSKPCFVCGSLEHASKKCTKGRCFFCQQGGHRMKNCPEKNGAVVDTASICLRCGDSGHDMFSCRHDYSPRDLREIQCYACKCFGHICCVDSIDAAPIKVSCYKCGHLGHSGVECDGLSVKGKRVDVRSTESCYNCGGKEHAVGKCPRLAKACIRSPGDGGTVGMCPSGSCYNCGDEGHMTYECTSSSKVSKRRRTRKLHKDDKNYLGFMSDPQHSFVKRGKKQKIRHEDSNLATPSKSKQRSSWIMDDPEDLAFPASNSKQAHWPSPSTSTNRRRKFHNWSSIGGNSGSRSFRKVHKVNSGTSAYPAKAFQHQSSASRLYKSKGHRRGELIDQ